MESHHLIVWLIIGLFAGALAGRLVEGGGFGILGDIVVGLIGAVIGGVMLHALTGGGDAARGFFAECVVAFAGAVTLLWVLRLLGRGGGHSHGRRRAFRR